MDHGDRVSKIGYMKNRNNAVVTVEEIRENLDRDYFRRKYGDDRVIRCKFFDETLNREFLT